MSTNTRFQELLRSTSTNKNHDTTYSLEEIIEDGRAGFESSENKSDFLFRVMPKLASCFSKTDAYSPEEIVQFLSGFPRHTGQIARFIAMDEYLSKKPSTTPSEVMAEAAIKLVILHQQLNSLSIQLNKEITKIKWRIDLLDKSLKNLLDKIARKDLKGEFFLSGKETIENDPKVNHASIERIDEETIHLRSEIDQKNLNFNRVKQQILTYMDEMTGIIVFFDAYQSYINEKTEEENTNFPMFIDEDIALRIIDRQKK